MSNGHYDYMQYKILELAESIEFDFINDGKTYSEEFNNFNWKFETIESDYLINCTEEEKLIIIPEIKSLIKDLKTMFTRVTILDSLISGDYAGSTYINKLNELNETIT